MKKRFTLILASMLLTMGAWAQTVEIEISTSTSALENQYEIKSAANLWMTAYTSPSNTMPGRFAFFGGTDGAYQIYSIDKEQWVSYTKSESYTDGPNKATFVNNQEDAESWNVTKVGDYYQFAPYKTNGEVATIYWNWHGGVSSNPVNNTSKTIGYYAKGAATGDAGDNGSRWILSKAETATSDAYQAAKNLLGTGVGYPNTTSEAYAALNALEVNSTANAVELAKNAYLNCTDIEMPVDGGVYQFTFVDNKGSKEFKMSASGNTLSANGETLSNFYCRKFTNVNNQVRYAFISMDGKFLAYNGLTDSYVIHKTGYVAEVCLRNDFTIEAMATASNNYITSTKEQRVGLLSATCPVRNESNSSAGCLIVQISNGTFNNSSSPYDNGSYTSAIKMVAVQDAEITEAALISSSTIDAILDGKKKIGTGLGCYTYIYGGNSGNDFATFESLIKTTTKVIEAGEDYSFEINLPEVGKFYRLKNNASSWYASSDLRTDETDYSDRLYMKENGTTASTIWYLTADNKLLSFTKGQYLGDMASNGDWTFEAVGSEGNVVSFNESAVVGKYQILPSSGRALYGDKVRVDAAGSGNKSGNYAWAIEEVTELPVTIGTVGYATLHAPVALTIPTGVKAYTGTLNGEWLTLNEVSTTIPANTAVILEATEKPAEATTFNFTVTTNVAEIEGNDLVGTIETVAKTGTPYTLQSYNDGVAFKQYTGDNLTGFKAYLVVEGNAQAIRVTRGDEEGTTSIDNAQLTIDNENVVIYDLQGRRVEKMEKGIYIVNGKKIIK